jgi:Cu(I)/Ag(I) efflux system membrane fusion protein/cobalt-zinc-cadmium efflux system membrane fusion protein
VKNKKIIIGIIAFIIIIVPLYLFVLDPGGDDHTHTTADGQLYTCGMHPEIILDEPGICPICEMDLTPVKTNGNTKSTGERKILYWRAPMDPNEIYDSPGKSNMGMDLVPVYEDEADGSGIVTIDPEVQQNMNVKTEVVVSKSLSSEVTTNGVLATDETSEYIATTRVNGWIEKLYINYTGQKVRKGDKLIDIYSPELVAAQQELLTALSYNQSVKQTNFKEIIESGEELIRNAVRKLQLFNISDSEIEGIIATGKVKTYLTLYAKNSGTVLTKNVREGAKIAPGTELVRIADLSKLWLLADVYEYELSKVHIGSKAEIRFNFLRGKIYNGSVSFIYPTLDPVSRTAKIRIVIDNSSGKLKPAMFANIIIKGEEISDRPVIPENALLRSGSRDIVILVLGDGKFKPVNVELGNYANGYYQVLKGINEGNKIVTSAQFLIDSESNLRAAINQFQSGDTKTQGDKQKMKDETHNHSSSLVREGVIDVESIDVNEDGKLFECPMDWNVLSDEDGRCPVCNMYLKEFTIDEIKANLNKYGFEYKSK